MALEKCIHSIKVQNGFYKIIVIDNNSEFIFKEKIRKIEGIKLIENDKNIGFGKACNQAIELAIKSNSTYIYLLNQDAWLDTPNHLSRIMAKSTSSNMAIISPLQLQTKDKFEFNFLKLLIKNNLNPSFFGDTIYKVSFVNAAAWFMNIKEIKTRFDTDFFMYGEDYHFAKELRKSGLQIGIYEGCAVFHPKKIKYEDDLKILKKVNYGFFLSEWKIPKVYKSKVHLIASLSNNVLRHILQFNGWSWHYCGCIVVLLFRLYKFKSI